MPMGAFTRSTVLGPTGNDEVAGNIGVLNNRRWVLILMFLGVGREDNDEEEGNP